MRAWLAIAAGLGIGVGIAWWLSKEGPDAGNERLRAWLAEPAPPTGTGA